MLADWAGERTREQAVAELTAAGIPAAPVLSYAEAAREPTVGERDMLQRVEQPDGTAAPITGPPAKFSRTPTRVRTGAPALGAHTGEILEELGLEAEEIRRLRDRGVVSFATGT
jgi:crotonobetainyl-CoA:carnitine CoA-transferase CaiB-like acyl-CoA transferase